jgi:hypothetical protein
LGVATRDRVEARACKARGKRSQRNVDGRKMLSQVRLSRSLLRIFYSLDAALQAA